MNSNIAKTKQSGEAYEIQYVVHGVTGDVYACYRLSNYDGMPIGPLVWIHAANFDTIPLGVKVKGR